VTDAPPALEPEYITPQQLAARLQLSVKSIYRLVSTDPTIPATRIHGAIRFHRERLERWLKSCEQGPGRRRTNGARA
jgi:excisionase family DNA binding protein